ncbi:MAG: type II toxin-antitoxin system prevent-host-death family antitoxin [Actinophytocola sp.]|nr:type II toxin-antitoxin system prevent-host-death family antitoxin [Actinophytocola sp.]
MATVGIRELRQHASRYVALAKGGEHVAVTDRGKLVAYLVPAEQAGPMLERLEAAGQYRPAARSIFELAPPPQAPEGAQPLSEALAELRDEERW